MVRKGPGGLSYGPIRTMKSNARLQAGASLIEALIAVVLVSFGVLGLVRLQGTIHANSVTSKARTQAQLLAREVLDTMAGSEDPAAFGDGEDLVPGSFASYSRHWSVRANEVGDATGTVTVRWADSRGQGDYVVLSSVLSKGAAVSEGKLLAASGLLAGSGSSEDSAVPPPWTVSSGSNPPATPTPSPGPVPGPDPTSAQVTAHQISGAVVVTGKADIQHVTVTADNGGTCTLAGSSYTCSVPNAWSGAIAVTSVAHQQVSPGPRAYSNVTADIGGQNYIVSK